MCVSYRTTLQRGRSVAIRDRHRVGQFVPTILLGAVLLFTACAPPGVTIAPPATDAGLAMLLRFLTVIMACAVVFWALLDVPIVPFPAPADLWRRSAIVAVALVASVIVFVTTVTADVPPQKVGQNNNLGQEASSSSADGDLSLRVFDWDPPGEGVAARVYLTSHGQRPKLLGATDSEGMLRREGEDWCEEQQMILVQPSVRYEDKHVDCPVARELNVGTRRATFMSNLRWYERFLKEKERFKELALVLNELGVTLNSQGYLDRAKRVAAEVWPVPFEGPALDSSDAISSSFKSAIERYQEEKRLRVTGELDYPTLEALAGTPIWSFVSDRDGLIGADSLVSQETRDRHP